jgi:signal transduction histidine kinase
MSDETYIKVLFVLLWLLFFLAAYLIGRRLGWKRSADWRARYTRMRGVCILYGILFLIETIFSFHRQDQSLFKKLLLPGSFALCFGIMYVQFLRARRKWRAQPDFARQKISRPTPVFFWQAVLILLPVALMAGFGFWAILRERSAVEHEAQQRAQEILQALPTEFGRIAADRLTILEAEKSGWYRHLEGGISPWPENKNRKQWLADTNESQTISNNLVGLHSAFPDWREGPVPLVAFVLNTNGDLDAEPSLPPRPPAWLATLSARQQQSWAALQTAADATESWSNRITAFQLTQPPAPALACAKFMQLRADLTSLPATNAINQLLRFAGRHDNDLSESGVPLKTLALAAALQRARDCGPSEPLWERLQSEISSPTALTPILLDEAGQLVAGDPQLSEAVKALHILLADKRAQSELAGAVKQTGKLHGITTTNLWLDAMGRHWFCILSPSAMQTHTTISNRPVSTRTPITQVACYPASVVARGLAEALGDAKVSLPPYFSISLELEGERVPLPSPWGRLESGKSVSNILAEAHFQMSQRAGTTIRDSDGGPEGKKALFLAMPESRQEGQNIFFEAMPSHPQFSLQIRLTNRSLLYARQRQLQITFGALIAASALAALIGFVAAYRAFRREQRLNEMKTNFVSSVSHELRAPIASVRLMAENLESGKVPDPARQSEYFRFIGQECRRLSSLIENVLDFSRIEQGRKQYEFEPTDLVALTRTTVKLMEPYAMEKGVSLNLETSNAEHRTPNLELKMDGRAIQQALVNLIDNAVKHSAPKQAVTVGLEMKNESAAPEVHLFVADHGPGIPAAEQERIFERFYRLGSELRRETQGIGIGLSIVKHIVAAHGGRVTVDSAPGHGSRFTIVLPVKK